jgi:uncharacterized membrane protein
MSKVITLGIAVIIFSFLIGIVFYPSMPDMMASHWNSKGEVDGYLPKFWGLFLMPIISMVMLLLLIFLPKIDPLRKNIEKFRDTYEGFVLIVILFMLYIYAISLMWNKGFQLNMATMVLPAMGVLFWYAASLMEKAKRNWFIGIRTPWTLSSENVWNLTHKAGARLFRVLAVLFLLLIFTGDYGFIVLVIALVSVLLFLFGYSYYLYRKEKNNISENQISLKKKAK